MQTQQKTDAFQKHLTATLLDFDLRGPTSLGVGLDEVCVGCVGGLDSALICVGGEGERQGVQEGVQGSW